MRRRSIPHKGFPDRESFDRAVSAELEKHGVGLVALAGFMRIQSPWFPAHWKDRIINIHPSLLPAFPGLHVQQQAIDAGARISGCTVHFVTPTSMPGRSSPRPRCRCCRATPPTRLLRASCARSTGSIPMVVRWFAEGRLSVAGAQVAVAGLPTGATLLFSPDP